MKSLFRFVIRTIFLIIFLLICFAGIDYYRMTKGNLPIFQIPTYNSKTRENVFHGTFYTAKRTVRANPDEPLEESSKIEYYFFQIPVQLKVEKKKIKNPYQEKYT